MSGYPAQQQDYDDGYGHSGHNGHNAANTDSYYQDDHPQQYYDNNNNNNHNYGYDAHGAQQHNGADGYYDEA
jgi:1,3-beta-glucan synthase